MKREGAAGWHGKLPTVSDFASRRLDARFVDLWDRWVSAGLAKLRADDGDHWVDAYLAAPTWRFVLTPGFLPEPFHTASWAGVLMPSVDRVGRYYPLTLAAPLQEAPLDVAMQGALWPWLQCLEGIAIGALDADWSIDTLENELFRLGLPPQRGDLQPVAAHQTAATGPAAEFFASAGSPCCVWHSAVDGAPRVLRSRALDESICGLWAS
jgi:type VI secretion system protein ImpM